VKPATTSVPPALLDRVKSAKASFAGAVRELRRLQHEMRQRPEWKRTARWKKAQGKIVGPFTDPEPETALWQLEDAIDAVLSEDLVLPLYGVDYLGRRLKEVAPERRAA